MQVHYNFEDFGNINNAVVTTGSFDGVHTGHRVIIQRINFLAKAIGGESVLITFFPHPRKVLFPEQSKELFMINSSEEKEYLLSNTGLDHLFIINFTIEFSKTQSDVFVKNILLAKLKAKIIVVGFNHHFGHNREGDYNYLYQLSREMKFRVEEIPQQDIENEAVSSTRIRKALVEGKIGRANAYLNHPFFILSKSFILYERLINDINSYIMQVALSEKILPPQGRYAAKILHSKGLNNILCDIFERQVFVYLPEEITIECNINIITELHMQIKVFDHKDDMVNKNMFMTDIVYLSELIY